MSKLDRPFSHGTHHQSWALPLLPTKSEFPLRPPENSSVDFESVYDPWNIRLFLNWRLIFRIMPLYQECAALMRVRTRPQSGYRSVAPGMICHWPSAVCCAGTELG